jgi:succinyl-CoA synthetase alpha subunit
MSILIDGETKVIVQGITGRDGAFHTAAMLASGTRVVGGVTPGKGGRQVCGLPVYDSVREAVGSSGATCSLIFVPARFAPAALNEAAESDLELVVCISEGIPVLDMIENIHRLQERGIRLIGPNSPGLISPGKCKAGIMPAHIHAPGQVGVISRSGTLTYEVVRSLTAAGYGQSTCIGVGGDPVIGSSFTELLALFEADPDTRAVVLIGEIGGEDEERAAGYIRAGMHTPVAAFIAGRSAPAGKRMGHAGAIIAGGRGGAAAKLAAFKAAGVPVADSPGQIPALLAELGIEKRIPGA